jgi:hypothetical protein
MVPDISARITSILGSLIDVVQPAIDKNDAAAQEQAHLAIASLRVVQNQLDYAHAFEAVDCQSLIALIRGISEILQKECPPEVGRFASELTRPVVFTGQIRDANRRMRDLVASLVEQAADAADPRRFSRVTQSILAFEGLQIRRDRAFVAGTGFDVEAETLVSIADSFGLAGANSGGKK